MELSTLQRQAVVKLIGKKDKDNIYIKNWQQFFFLNVDYRFISKALAPRLKKVIPNLISPQPMAYVKSRFISESGRFLADIPEITDILNKEVFLVTMDI